ncbi:MAG: class I adenylate-forming enzyme family protein [Kiloniellales bacterium]
MTHAQPLERAERFSLDRLGSITWWQTGETTSADELRAGAARTAALMRQHGVGRGATVLIVHDAGPRFFADLFGVWNTGASAACLNPNLAADELRNITRWVKPAALLATANTRIPEGLDVPVLDTEAGAAEAPEPGPGGEGDDPALILFTSGTTGTPKGVVLSFRALTARIALNQDHIPRAAMRRTLCVLPTHFGHGLIGNCLTPLLAGHDLMIAPGTNLEVTGNLGRLIDDERITFMSSVPALWRRVLPVAEPPHGGTLERVHVGSAPLSAELWKRIMAWASTRDVVNMYGITEAANWIGGASAADGEPKDGFIGRAWGGAMAVRTAAGEVVRQGSGELLVRSPSLFKEYHRMPDATAAAFQDGWFRTGDSGRIEADGSAFLTGRIKSEINRGGLKVHPEDIDLLLERHPAVREACAFAIPDPVEGETIGMAVSLMDGTRVDARALRRWCAERLAIEKVPVKWFRIETIPRTDRGKLNRDAVARQCLARAAAKGR